MTNPLQQRPDAAAVRDWALYGPRDPQIAILVERLASERQMQLDEIERLIVDTLTQTLTRGGEIRR